MESRHSRNVALGRCRSAVSTKARRAYPQIFEWQALETSDELTSEALVKEHYVTHNQSIIDPDSAPAFTIKRHTKISAGLPIHPKPFTLGSLAEKVARSKYGVNFVLHGKPSNLTDHIGRSIPIEVFRAEHSISAASGPGCSTSVALKFGTSGKFGSLRVKNDLSTCLTEGVNKLLLVTKP